MSVNETLNRIESEVDTQEGLIQQIQTALAGKMDGSAPRLQAKTVSINSNGSTVVTANAGYDGLSAVNINVDIASSGTDTLKEIMLGEIVEFSSDVTSIYQYAFYKQLKLKTVNLPNADELSIYAFSGCEALTTINIPNVTYVSSNCFQNCYGLTSIKLPKIDAIGSGPFLYCRALATIDIGSNGVVTNLGTSAFRECSTLSKLILRNDSVCTYGTTQTSYDPSNANLKIYVPRSLVDSYKTATNWSRLADKFVALEDYTNDGTTTGVVIG